MVVLRSRRDAGWMDSFWDEGWEGGRNKRMNSEFVLRIYEG